VPGVLNVEEIARAAVVRSVTVMPEGITIEYVVPVKDVHQDGLTFNHAVFLPDDAYDEVNATIRRACKLGVATALVSAAEPANAPLAEPPDVRDDDEVGPYEYAPSSETGAEDDRTDEDRQARSQAVTPAGNATGS
jgi:hypothetical protein